MPLDPRIKAAVRDVIREAEQDKALADRLLSWLDALVDGNEKLDDADAAAKRSELLYEVTTVEELHDED